MNKETKKEFLKKKIKKIRDLQNTAWRSNGALRIPSGKLKTMYCDLIILEKKLDKLEGRK